MHKTDTYEKKRYLNLEYQSLSLSLTPTQTLIARDELIKTQNKTKIWNNTTNQNKTKQKPNKSNV